MIDWSKLKSYQGNKYRSFEELCYQIAKVLYRDKGVFISIDDSGGGDGVEFYLELPNSDHWGWQAKFYHPDKKLSASSRKKSIKDSLKKACEVHPKLKKWTLCTPIKFTTSEQKWFNETLPKVIPDGMEVELKHWGDSEFNNWLSEPRFSGKYHYFFGELELDINWFQRQFDTQIAAIVEKFNPSLHTDTSVDTAIHALLGDEEFVKQIETWIEELNEKVSELNKRIDTIKRQPLVSIDWSEKEKLKVVEAGRSLQKQLVITVHKFEQTRQLLKGKRFHEVEAVNWKSIQKQLYDAVDNYADIANESGISKIQYTGEEKNRKQVLFRIRNIISSPASLLRTLLDNFFPRIFSLCELMGQAELNILGEAGIGKTHTACNVCSERLESGLPAIFIRGSSFSNASIEDQLRKTLDIPPSYSWNDFLRALSAVAGAYHTRIPLIIDGLNEAIDNGTLSNVWKLGMKGFVEEIKQIKNIALITTCRTSYQKEVWGDGKPNNVAYAHELKDEETENMLEKYFDHYKIKADLTAAPLEQFRHPLYVKIFCETKNGKREIEKQIHVGERALFEIFDEYLKQCNEAVCQYFGHRTGTDVLQPILDKMADNLWENRSRHIPVDKLANMIDGQPPTELKWLSSKTHALESEGILVCRDIKDEEEVMCFTYDLLGGYLIAKYLVKQHKNDLEGFISLESTMKDLFDRRDGSHPLHEDISRCLAVLIPAETGQFLHNLSENNEIRGLSIRGLFEISPKHIDKHCIDLMSKLFKHKDNHEFLFEQAKATMASPNHPFNASFWSKQLEALSLVERDISWTEYVRKNSYYFEENIENFEKLCKDTHELSDIVKKRFHLMAEHTMWMLTSTVHKVRDKATRALYWYGRRLPKEFFELVVKSLLINDPYVSERMLAATYGVAMARQYDFKDKSFVRDTLPLYVKELYEKMFNPDAPHSTTHILARDYARRTIDIALLHHPDLLTNEEKQRIRPPFKDGGIREWGGSENIDDVDHKNKTAILELDFENYTIGRLVEDRAPYDYEHEEYKRVQANILWRVYDLGYSHEVFRKIDDWIGYENDRYEMHAGERKMDRYGKKYAWIAYYEVAGFREDNDLLRKSYTDAPRILDIDIDPSFPVEQQGDDIIKQVDDQSISGKGWTSKSNHMSLTPYLVVDKLCSENGSWVLLDGYIRQKDEQSSSEMFAVIMGVIVKSNEINEVVEILKQMNIGDWSMRSRPQDYCTYAGEIPWCDTYKKNSLEKFSVEKPEPRVFKYVSPVRENGWQNDCSPILDSRSVLTPSRHIAEVFDLCGQPQSFDLFQKNGQQASINVSQKDKHGNTQSFTYLRKDLLDHYLKKINGSLIWLMFGQRTLKSQNDDTFVDQLKDVKIYSCVKKNLQNNR